MSNSIFLLKVEVPQDYMNRFTPGKFSMLRVSRTLDPLLNRPLSISFVEREKNRLSFLYRLVGKGTKLLSEMNPGDSLSITYPLGNGFPIRQMKASSFILLGGGIGIAPLLSLFSGDSLPAKTTLLWGIKSQEEYFDFKKISGKLADIRFLIATEDGSLGFKGTVLDLFISRIKKTDSLEGMIIFACGPIKMLRSLHVICKRNLVPLFVSLETRMACGTGLCMGCAVPSVKGTYLKTCQDGPVFPSSILLWEDIYELH